MAPRWRGGVWESHNGYISPCRRSRRLPAVANPLPRFEPGGRGTFSQRRKPIDVGSPKRRSRSKKTRRSWPSCRRWQIRDALFRRARLAHTIPASSVRRSTHSVRGTRCQRATCVFGQRHRTRGAHDPASLTHSGANGLRRVWTFYSDNGRVGLSASGIWLRPSERPSSWQRHRHSCIDGCNCQPHSAKPPHGMRQIRQISDRSA